eukprot:gene38053-18621_t
MGAPPVPAAAQRRKGVRYDPDTVPPAREASKREKWDLMREAAHAHQL